MMDDDNMIYVYFYRPATSINATINSTLGDEAEVSPEIHYYRAVLAFLVSILLYFCLVCHAWKNDTTEAKPADIDKSLVRKKVLAHGQSRRFDEVDDNARNDEQHKKTRIICSCCCKKQTHPADPLQGTAEEILDSYKLKTYRELREQAMQRRRQINGMEPSTYDDELVVAEEGVADTSTCILCPICLEPFNIGEEVAWSKLQQCRHVFHYECILPWAVLGHVHCPVCREVFWSRHWHKQKECTVCGLLKSDTTRQNGDAAESALETSRFCVIHGLTYPCIETGV